jgi:hypothetical protein
MVGCRSDTPRRYRFRHHSLKSKRIFAVYLPLCIHAFHLVWGEASEASVITVIHVVLN